jgi:hypothetical protein
LRLADFRKIATESAGMRVPVWVEWVIISCTPSLHSNESRWPVTFAQAGAAAGALCFVVIAIAFALLVSAVILRAACSLYNKIAGSESGGVPEPSFGKALGIIAVTMLANFVVSFVVGIALGAAGQGGQQRMSLMANLVSLPISIAVLAGILTAMLPTTFPRGLVVALLYLVVAIVIGLVIGVIVVVVMMAAGLAIG